MLRKGVLSLLAMLCMCQSGLAADPILLAQFLSPYDDYRTYNFSLYAVSTSGAVKDVAPVFYDGSFYGSGVSTFDYTNSVYYSFLALDSPAPSSLYAFDSSSPKPIADFQFDALSTMHSMHWDSSSQGIYAYGKLKQSSIVETLIYFPTSNCSDVQIVANVTQLGLPSNAIATTALDSENRVIYFIYLAQNANGRYSRVLSSLSLTTPTSLKTIPVQWSIAELSVGKRAFFDPTAQRIVFYGAIYTTYWSVYVMDPATGTGSKNDIRFGGPNALFSDYGSAYDTKSQTLYLVGQLNDPSYKLVLAHWQKIGSNVSFDIQPLNVSASGNFNALEVAY